MRCHCAAAQVCVYVYVCVVSGVCMLFIYRFIIWVGLTMCIVFMRVLLSFHGVIITDLHDGGWLCCGFCAYVWCVTAR